MSFPLSSQDHHHGRHLASDHLCPCPSGVNVSFAMDFQWGLHCIPLLWSNSVCWWTYVVILIWFEISFFTDSLAVQGRGKVHFGKHLWIIRFISCNKLAMLLLLLVSIYEHRMNSTNTQLTVNVYMIVFKQIDTF